MASLFVLEGCKSAVSSAGGGDPFGDHSSFGDQFPFNGRSPPQQQPPSQWHAGHAALNNWALFAQMKGQFESGTRQLKMSKNNCVDLTSNRNL